MRMISVLIADDHLLLREALAHFLTRDGGFSIATVASLPEAIQRVAEGGSYDIMLLDIAMPGMNGLTGVSEAIAANTGGAIVIMSGTVRREFVEAAMLRGARGYIPKTLPARALAQALRQVASGKVYLPPEMPPDVQIAALPPALSSLSPQEARVLRHLCQGLSNKEIARSMAISEVTIKTHMRAICAKLNARNRTHAALIGTTHLMQD